MPTVNKGQRLMTVRALTIGTSVARETPKKDSRIVHLTGPVLSHNRSHQEAFCTRFRLPLFLMGLTTLLYGSLVATPKSSDERVNIICALRVYEEPIVVVILGQRPPDETFYSGNGPRRHQHPVLGQFG
jgi:hypothetical protein